jgi:hypothetical protein
MFMDHIDLLAQKWPIDICVWVAYMVMISVWIQSQSWGAGRIEHGDIVSWANA